MMKRYVLTIVLLGAMVGFSEEEKTPRNWDAHVYAGLTIHRGNTTKNSYRYGADLKKTYSEQHRCFLRMDGRYSKTDDEVSESKNSADVEVHRRLKGPWFSSGTLSYKHDDLKEIRYRTKVGPGIGYYLIETDELSADIGTGLVYVHERTEVDTDHFIGWRSFERFKWKLTDTLDLWSDGELVLSTQNLSDFTVTFRLGLDTKLSRHFSLVMSLTDEYDNTLDGSNVKKNDFELSSSLRYTF